MSLRTQTQPWIHMYQPIQKRMDGVDVWVVAMPEQPETHGRIDHRRVELLPQDIGLGAVVMAMDVEDRVMAIRNPPTLVALTVDHLT